MDKYTSEEEKIRRAEEIAERRRNRIPASSINVNKKKKLSFISKLFIQVICSMCIFGLFYFINQNNSLAMEKIKPLLSEDTDFVGIYNQINNFFKNASNKLNKSDDVDNAINEQNNERVDNTDEFIENASDELNSQGNENLDNNVLENNDENTENAIEQDENIENPENENNGNNEDVAGIGGGEGTELSETEQDIVYIKENGNFIKPVNGWITSPYGEREATEIISANHAGVDIGANTGTEILASMSGTVELVSSEGDYGNHLIITNGEISTLYAHCSQIIVNQGEYVNQGQKIAKVGSTGRTTGPHLHFEIRRNNKTVDPQKILDL